jgi:hypothetical protein
MINFEHGTKSVSVPLKFIKQNVIFRIGKIYVVRTGKKKLKLRHKFEENQNLLKFNIFMGFWLGQMMSK